MCSPSESLCVRSCRKRVPARERLTHHVRLGFILSLRMNNTTAREPSRCRTTTDSGRPQDELVQKPGGRDAPDRRHRSYCAIRLTLIVGRISSDMRTPPSNSIWVSQRPRRCENTPEFRGSNIFGTPKTVPLCGTSRADQERR